VDFADFSVHRSAEEGRDDNKYPTDRRIERGGEFSMTEENKALERRLYEEIYNKKNIAAAEQFIAANWVYHPSPPGVPPGLEGMKLWHALTDASSEFEKAFPDMQAKLEDMVAEGDKVACRYTATGTHSGEYMGVPPTNKQITVTGIHIDRIAGGKVVETWDYSDMLGVMQQLGIIPSPGQPKK